MGKRIEMNCLTTGNLTLLAGNVREAEIQINTLQEISGKIYKYLQEKRVYVK